MKGTNRKQKLITGAFVAGITIITAIVILATGDGGWFRRSTRFYATFSNTAGLSVGAPVKMGGVQIGSVEEIGIEQGKAEPRVRLTLTIDSPHESLLKSDSVVTQETQGVLGDTMLTVSAGTAGAGKAAPRATLPTKERFDVTAIVEDSGGIIKNVNQATEKLDEFVGTLPDAATMKSITDDFRESSKQLSQILAVMNAKDSALRAVSDPANAARMNAILRSLENAARHMESVAAKVDGGKGSLGALVNDSGLYDDMRQLLGRANRSKAAKFVIRQVLDDGAGGSTRE